MGGWRGTLGTHDLNPQPRGSRGTSDETFPGQERCLREARDLTAGRYSPELRGVFGRPLILCHGADPIPWR